VPLVTYSLARLGLLGVAVLGLYAAGMRGWLLALVAVVVAFALSYVLLGRQRDAAARWLAERDRVRRANRRPDADTAAEDAEVDRLLGDDG